MTLKIKNHWLCGDFGGKEVKEDRCEGKDSGFFTGNLPDTIVIHFTAGPTMASAVNTLKNPDVKASAHMVIDLDGSIKQLIGFDRIAWHAGKSMWRGRTGLNRYSVGIELVNAGELKPSGDQYVSWFGGRYEKNEVIEAAHRNQTEPSFWHSYTREQMEACFEVCHVLKLNYPIDWILGHEEIAPRRKTDPGPAFPLDRLREHVIVGRDDNGNSESNDPVAGVSQLKEDRLPVATVTASLLNFRQQPHKNALAVGNPLPSGKQVELVDRSGRWCKVRVYTEGWVHGDYLRIEG